MWKTFVLISTLSFISANLISTENISKCTEYSPCVRFCCANCTIDFNVKDKPGADKFKRDYAIIQGRPCQKMYALEPEDYPEDAWSFQTDGRVKSEHQEDATFQYCFQKYENTETLHMLLCYVEDTKLTQRTKLYSTLILISLPFLIITFGVYALINELRHLHGKCLMCYVLSLIILHIDLAIIQLDFLELGLNCIFAGFLLYFAAVVNNFWLNVMSFDIWQSLKNLRTTTDSRNRFKVYCYYAFGVPIILTVLMAVLDYMPSESFDDFRPNIGRYRCAIHSNEVYFFVIPLGIVNVISLMFIALAALSNFKRSTVENSTGYTRLNAEKDRLMMYLKLLVFMTVFWSFEFIAHFIEFDHFIITDILNCLQGIIIFIIFVMQKNVRKLIMKKYNLLRGFPEDELNNAANNDDDEHQNK